MKNIIQGHVELVNQCKFSYGPDNRLFQTKKDFLCFKMFQTIRHKIDAMGYMIIYSECNLAEIKNSIKDIFMLLDWLEAEGRKTFKFREQMYFKFGAFLIQWLKYQEVNTDGL